MRRIQTSRGVRVRDDDDFYKFEWFGNNRHLCDVLEDMRRCQKTMNFSMLKGLIEEAQVMAQRMEDALRDQKDLLKLQKETSDARRAYKSLKKRYEELKEKVVSLDKEVESQSSK